MAQLTLHFAHNAGKIELEKTVFLSSLGVEYIAVRGKTAGAFKCSGSFQWTPAVKGVCALFLQSRTLAFGCTDATAPTISGRRGSLAASLDYAIDKEPHWLCDMFGLDHAGKTNLRRLIFRSNSGGKRPGPISLSLNESALPPEHIQIMVNSFPVEDQVSLDKIIATLTDSPPHAMKLLQLSPFNLAAPPAHAKRNSMHRIVIADTAQAVAIGPYLSDDTITQASSA